VNRGAVLLCLSAALGCSGLTEGEAGVVGIEVSIPGPDTVEVGETIQLSARPLDKNGDSAGTAVTWISTDASATIDPFTGALTGVAPGATRVQATVGALGSELITFTVIAAADTLAISGDSIFTAAVDDAAVLPSLVTLLSSFNPAGPLPGRGVIYTITSPDPTVSTPSVLINSNGSGVVSDTILTGTDGTAVAALAKAAGAAPPESLVVTVSAVRTRGATVPGSGQRFIIRFTP
jgi:hypothetical protein